MVEAWRLMVSGAGGVTVPSACPSRLSVHSACCGSESTFIDCVVAVVTVAQPPSVSANPVNAAELLLFTLPPSHAGARLQPHQRLVHLRTNHCEKWWRAGSATTIAQRNQT